MFSSFGLASLFTIVCFFKQHGFRGVLYCTEKSYEASLYHSKQPSSQGSQFKRNLYLSVAKKIAMSFDHV